jgi:cytochrome c biogenesis protein CcmG/thiol:disulfide interchange protein DsbE
MSNRTRPTKSGTSARPAAAPGSKGGLPIWVPLGILAAVAVAIVVAVALSGGGDDDTVVGSDDEDLGGVSLDLAFGEVEVVGDPLPPLPQSGVDPAVGITAPGVRGFGPDSVEQVFVNGQPRAVMFVAHWCPHCQDELNEINAFIDGGGTLPSGVEIQTIATWSDEGRENFPPGEWLADNNWHHRTIVDDEAFTLAGSLGLAGTPMWIFIDGDGTIIERTGSLPVAELVSRLESLAA